MPGDCATYDIEVEKHYEPGYLVFSTPGAPEQKNETISLDDWRQDHWTVQLDFSNAPGPRDPADVNSPRLWPMDTTYVVVAEICAPYNANAGLGPAVTVKAHLEGYPRVSDKTTFHRVFPQVAPNNRGDAKVSARPQALTRDVVGVRASAWIAAIPNSQPGSV